MLIIKFWHVWSEKSIKKSVSYSWRHIFTKMFQKSGPFQKCIAFLFWIWKNCLKSIWIYCILMLIIKFWHVRSEKSIKKSVSYSWRHIYTKMFQKSGPFQKCIATLFWIWKNCLKSIWIYCILMLIIKFWHVRSEKSIKKSVSYSWKHIFTKMFQKSGSFQKCIATLFSQLHP